MVASNSSNSSSSSNNSNNLKKKNRNRVSDALLFAAILVGWFGANSLNGIAMQLVRQAPKNNHQQHAKEQQEDDEEESSFLSQLTVATVITALQLLLGAVLGTILLRLLDVCWFRHKALATTTTDKLRSATTTSTTPTTTTINNIKNQYNSIDTIAVLHALGSLATNLGFLYGKASLVQIIKLLEPFETLLFVKLWQQRQANNNNSTPGQGVITTGIVASMTVTVVAAISLVHGQGGGVTANPHATAFAILSGLTLSARNVVQRGQLSQQQQQQQQQKQQVIPLTTSTTSTANTATSSSSSSTTTTTNRGDSRLVASLTQFQTMSYASGLVLVIPAVLLQVLVRLSSSSSMPHHQDHDVAHLVVQHMQVFAWHPLYNVFSICMLGMVTALTHSLLNASKRVVSILVAIVWFHEPLGWSTVASLTFVLLGGAWYSYESKKAKQASSSLPLKGHHGMPNAPSNGHPSPGVHHHHHHHPLRTHQFILPLITLLVGFGLGNMSSSNLGSMTNSANQALLDPIMLKSFMESMDMETPPPPAPAVAASTNTLTNSILPAQKHEEEEEDNDLVYDPNFGFRSTKHVPRRKVIQRAKQIIRDSIGRLIRRDKPIACINLYTSSDLGDAALMNAQFALFKDLGIPHHLLRLNHTVPSPVDDGELPSNLANDLKTIIDAQGGTVLILAAGGNMGDTFPTNQNLVDAVIRLVPRARVIQLPQSLVVQNETRFRTSTVAVHQAHPDVHLFMRDGKSFQLAQSLEMAPHGRTYLVPDLTFFLGYIEGRIQHVAPEKPIALVLRTDEEAESQLPKTLDDVYGPIDWQGKDLDKDPALGEQHNQDFAHSQSKEEYYDKEMNRARALLSKGVVVIADRLHAQILSFLLNKPLVAIRDKGWQGNDLFDTWTHVSSEDTKFEVTFDGALARARELAQHQTTSAA